MFYYSSDLFSTPCFYINIRKTFQLLEHFLLLVISVKRVPLLLCHEDYFVFSIYFDDSFVVNRNNPPKKFGTQGSLLKISKTK